MTTLNKFVLSMLVSYLVVMMPLYAEETAPQNDTPGLEDVVEYTTFDTDHLVDSATEDLSECVNYCIVGVAYRIVIGYFGATIYVAPIINHNNLDFVVMANREFGEEPWEDWAEVFAEAEEEISTAAYGPLLNTMNFGGGQHAWSGYGKHQSNNYKELTVAGHPLAILPQLLSDTGTDRNPDGSPCETDGCLENDPVMGEAISQSAEEDESQANEREQSSEERSANLKQAAVSYLTKYMDNISECDIDNCPLAYAFVDPAIIEAFEYVEWIMKMKEYADRYKEMKRMMNTVMASVAASGSFSVQVRIEEIICENNVYLFLPYYMSAIDALPWKLGYPLADLAESTTIWNPWSDDVIGTRGDKFGHLYPRDGTVNQVHDAKVAAVLAERAFSVVNEGTNTRFALSPGYKPLGRWQMVHPEVRQCHANIAHKPEQSSTEAIADGDPTGGDFIEPNLEGTYAWHAWRNYECETNFTGEYIGETLFDPVCLDF